MGASRTIDRRHEEILFPTQSGKKEQIQPQTLHRVKWWGKEWKEGRAEGRRRGREEGEMEERNEGGEERGKEGSSTLMLWSTVTLHLHCGTRRCVSLPVRCQTSIRSTIVEPHSTEQQSGVITRELHVSRKLQVVFPPREARRGIRTGIAGQHQSVPHMNFHVYRLQNDHRCGWCEGTKTGWGLSINGKLRQTAICTVL